MAGTDEDDKPTVVLDLNALKKQTLKQEEDLANLASELEFNVGQDKKAAPAKPAVLKPVVMPEMSDEDDSEVFAVKFLGQRKAEVSQPKVAVKNNFPVILFDLQSDFFQKSKDKFPKGFDYKIVSDLGALNTCLKNKSFQIVVFNYDVNPKAVNQLCAQIKAKLRTTKIIIMARAIKPEAAKAHAATASGAHGYYQYPLDAAKIEKEFLKIHSSFKKVS